MCAWTTSVPTLVFLGLSVLDLGLIYATDRLRTHVGQKHRQMPNRHNDYSYKSYAR